MTSDDSTHRPMLMRRCGSQNDLLYKVKKRGHKDDEHIQNSSLSLKRSKTVDNLFGLANFHNENSNGHEQSQLRLEPDVLRRFDSLSLNTTNDSAPQTGRSSSYGSDLGRTSSLLDESIDAPTGSSTTSSSIPHRQQVTRKGGIVDESCWSLDYSI